MIFPSGKISDVPLATNVSSPAGGAFHDSFIQSNGKKNILLFDSLPVKSMFYLVLYPITLDGVLRKNQKKLVVKSDRFIDHLTNFITDLHIMLSAPASDTGSLKIIMDSLDKFFVFMVIAYKARVILNWGCNQGSGIFDHLIRNTAATKKDFRNIALRFVECINTNSRRANMFDIFKTFNISKVYA